MHQPHWQGRLQAMPELFDDSVFFLISQHGQGMGQYFRLFSKSGVRDPGGICVPHPSDSWLSNGATLAGIPCLNLEIIKQKVCRKGPPAAVLTICLLVF